MMMRTCVWILAGALLLMAFLAGCKPAPRKAPLAPAPPPTAAAPTGAIKFGFNFEETGGQATFGASAHRGAELAVDELNSAGGLLGQQITPVWDDNGSMAGQAATVATKQINQDRVAVIVGALTSSNTIAIAKIAEESKVPMVSPAATNPAVTLNEDGTVRQYVFRACFTDDFQGERIANFAVNGPIKAKSAVIFYDAESDYSKGIWETVKRVAPGMGLKIVAEDSYLATSETDFRTKLNKFKGQKFDVLIVPGYYNQVALIANQARELGLTQPLLGGDGFDSPDLWKVAGKSIEGSYFTNHYSADDQDPAVQDFIRKFKERFGGQVPDAMAILSYDATRLAADAVTRAGSTDPAAIAMALSETKGFSGASGKITINAQHNAMKKLVVLKVGEGGKFTWVYTYEPGATAPTPATPAGTAKPAPANPPPAGGKAPGGGSPKGPAPSAGG